MVWKERNLWTRRNDIFWRFTKDTIPMDILRTVKDYMFPADVQTYFPDLNGR